MRRLLHSREGIEISAPRDVIWYRARITLPSKAQAHESAVSRCRHRHDPTFRRGAAWCPCPSRDLPSTAVSAATIHVLSVLLRTVLFMIALIAAVVSMVAAVTAAVILVLCHREVDERQSWISALVVGALATVLTVGLSPEIIRPALTCLAYLLTISGIAIVTKVTGIATIVTRAVVRWWRQRHYQHAVPDASLPGGSPGESPRQSSDPHSPNSQHPDVSATSTRSPT